MQRNSLTLYCYVLIVSYVDFLFSLRPRWFFVLLPSSVYLLSPFPSSSSSRLIVVVTKFHLPPILIPNRRKETAALNLLLTQISSTGTCQRWHSLSCKFPAGEGRSVPLFPVQSAPRRSISINRPRQISVSSFDACGLRCVEIAL